ncbi:hypothetical protein L1049_008276 [Liquidambar formosana]|uniref:HVA22-like protein n=1 Tax=Liquidambar formosana TaxID=63359 RepID=A0AAP0S409_LIQFO
MLGDFITRALVLLLGYAYPAFECFKTVEKNKVENDELRFWCQYWIIVAMLTVIERLGDTFVSWLPMYGELKLALFIYMWSPKTRGTRYIYESLLRPYVTRHETDIDRKMREWRTRAWDLAIFYWQNCTELGQEKFFDILHFLSAQSGRGTSNRTKKADHHHPNSPPPNKHQRGKQWTPPPPSAPPMFDRAVSPTPKSNFAQVHADSQTEYIHTEDAWVPYPVIDPGPTATPKTSFADRLWFRRSGQHQ